MAQVNKKLAFYRYFSRLIPVISAGLVLFCFVTQAHAITIISDEETELYIQDLVKPLFAAAEVPFDRNKIFVVEDNSLNAFVSEGNRLFINSETILKAANDDELRGVIAHEIGHIQGGHIMRYHLRMREMRHISLASMAAALALGAASGRGDVAAAIAMGSQSSLLNQSLSYQVQEERSADAAAVQLLKKIKHSPHGLLAFMKKIQAQNKLQGISENSYFRTHPMSEERTSFLQQEVQSSPYSPVSSKSDRLKRIQAKLYAFIKSPQQTYSKYPSFDNSLISSYARSIAAFKNLNFKQALSLADSLITKEPNNPHFHELKGQILFESGNIAEARKEFARSVSLLPTSSLFKINESQAALETSLSPHEVQTIITKLQQVLNEKPNSFVWLLLSKAYHLAGKKAEAQYAAAEYSAHNGDIDLAQRQAREAKVNSLDPRLSLKIEDLLHSLKEAEAR